MSGRFRKRCSESGAWSGRTRSGNGAGITEIGWSAERLFSPLTLRSHALLSSRAVDGHQMYSGGSALDKASTIGVEISPTPPLIFTGGQKVRNLASFKTSLKFAPHAFENAARYPKSETKVQCCDIYVLAKFGEVGSTHPEKALSVSVVPHP